MENSSSNKPDSIDNRSTNQLIPNTLPYPSNVAMCYAPQQPMSSPLGSSDASSQSAGAYLVPPPMASPSSCLTTQQMYSNYPSPYYRTMLTGSQQSSYYQLLPTGHHSSAFYGTFYNPSSPSVYPGSGQTAMNPMNYYSPSLHPYSMQNHESMWPSNNQNAPPQSSTAPAAKNPYPYENSDRTVQPPSCSKATSNPPAPLPETAIVEIPEQQQQPPPEQPSTVECSSTAVIETVKEPSEFLCEPLPDRPLSKAESVESLEGSAGKESDEEEGEDSEEQETDHEEVEEEESAYSTSTYSESYTSEDLPPIDDDDDILKDVPESILNDTSFGDFDHAKEDIVDDDLQCLLCNNFDHLIPRLDIAIKLEPVVGEPIYRSSVLLCTQCDLMLERYLSLEIEVKSLQAQIITMYQNNKQLMQPDKGTDDYQELDGVFTASSQLETPAVPSTDPGEPPSSVTDLQQTSSAVRSDPDSIQSQHSNKSPPDPSAGAQTTTDNQLSKSHSCSVCGKRYSDRRSLQRHMKNHSSEERQEQCDLCSESFSSRMALKAHQRQAHKEKSSLQCQECSRQFDRRSHFLYHVKVHHGPREFKCEICDKSFVTRVALTTHARIHSGEKPFICQTCNRGFNVNSNLLAHIPKCTGQLPFKCDQCDKAFGSRSLFQSHVKTHQGDFAVKCDICAMGFAKKSHLISHQRTHTKEKPFLCPVCGKAFSSVGNCNSHAKTHADERKFVCEICGRKFARRQALETHLNRHTGAKPYQCDQCDKSFHDPSNLFNHKKTHRSRSTGNETEDKIRDSIAISI